MKTPRLRRCGPRPGRNPLSQVISIFLLLIVLLPRSGPADNFPAIQAISLDFPLGATRLLVHRDGRVFLFYGSLPRHRSVRPGTFDIDELYHRLLPRLHHNLPREHWADPCATAGMVNLRFNDQARRTYLIFDGDFAQNPFERARHHIIEDTPGSALQDGAASARRSR